MGNRTIIPAFKCSVGDWNYFVCTMKYGEVARQINFAYELSGNRELGQLIQRGITKRTQDITQYLLASEHRFLNSMVVAAWGGEPRYTELLMEEQDGVLQGLDRGFGVLIFDGTQQYFVLDGQHRLRAIKDALMANPDLAKEDICVLIVTHYDTPEGRMRTRRLFTNINRNAKQTGAAENIALDEDDAFAVLTRRIIEEHRLLSQPGRVRVILSTSEDGAIKLAANSIPQGDPKALTTLTVLYDLLELLAFDLPVAIRTKSVRPTETQLEKASVVLCKRLDDLLVHCGDIEANLREVSSAKELRFPRVPRNGHPFMRPVIQKAIARVLSIIMQQERASWDELMHRLRSLSWRIGDAPWDAVFSAEKGKMLTSKDNTDLLVELLQVHLAPASKNTIERARRNYQVIRGRKYSVSQADLESLLSTSVSPMASIEPILPKGLSNKESITISNSVDEIHQNSDDQDEERGLVN